MVGKVMMATPVLANYHELLTKCLLITSFALRHRRGRHRPCGSSSGRPSGCAELSRSGGAFPVGQGASGQKFKPFEAAFPPPICYIFAPAIFRLTL